MRKMNLTLSAAFYVATIALSGSALAFNPQPDPPGRASTNLPADSCTKTQTVEYRDGEDATVRTRPGNQKPAACANKAVTPGVRGNSGVHYLNPQPLPPG